MRPMGQPPAPTPGLRLRGGRATARAVLRMQSFRHGCGRGRAGCWERGGGERAETCELGTSEGESLQVGGH